MKIQFDILKYKNFSDFISETAPPFLYKFRNWEDTNHKRIITDNEIYFCAPSQFKDEKDCRLPMSFDVSFIEAFQYACGLIDCNSVDFISVASNVCDLLHNKQRQQKHEKDSYEMFCEYVGICSLCTVNDNKKMWEKYADKAGFCVGFHTKNLCNKNIGGGGKVCYIILPKFRTAS